MGYLQWGSRSLTRSIEPVLYSHAGTGILQGEVQDAHKYDTSLKRIVPGPGGAYSCLRCEVYTALLLLIVVCSHLHTSLTCTSARMKQWTLERKLPAGTLQVDRRPQCQHRGFMSLRGFLRLSEASFGHEDRGASTSGTCPPTGHRL